MCFNTLYGTCMVHYTFFPAVLINNVDMMTEVFSLLLKGSCLAPAYKSAQHLPPSP